MISIDGGGAHSVQNFKISKILETLWCSGDDFLGVALVEYIDKRLILDLETAINRQGLTRAFQIATQRLDTTTAREDMDGNTKCNKVSMNLFVSILRL